MERKSPDHQPKDMSLLIVDDDVDSAHDLADALTLRKLDVHVVSSLRAGLEFIARTPPKYAIVELRLAGGTGIDAIEALMRARPDARALVLSCYGTIATAVSAAKHGAVDYLAKPSDVDQILSALLTAGASFPPAPEVVSAPREVRLKHIQTILQRCDNNISAAARLLGMHRRTLQRIVRRTAGDPAAG